jgi:hypothetical protein
LFVIEIPTKTYALALDGKLCPGAWVASLFLVIDNDQGCFLFQES